MRSDRDRRIPTAPSRVTMATKRVLDIVGAALGLLLLWPVFAVVALMIKLETPGPIFFRQERVGRGGRSFRIYKFRSMVVAPEHGGIALTVRADPRITRVGMFLRRSKLDELPQLINVLVGDMSIVGPRPHAVAHNEQYSRLIDEYLARHRVKPGITGWAQVNGLRGETETLEKMEQRVRYDLYYIENWSLAFDMRIILRTLFVGFSHPNAY